MLRAQWRKQGQVREAEAMIQPRDNRGFDQGAGEVHSDKCHTPMRPESTFFA